MSEGAAIARIAVLVADPSRSMMLGALMSGMALTANELANEAGVAASTASSHLAALLDAGLVGVIRQGRHRYYRLANDEVAVGLEQFGAIAVGRDDSLRRIGPRDPGMRTARLCYDHLAGAVGVDIYKGIVARGGLVLTADSVALTDAGRTLLAEVGVTAVDVRRPETRLCLDWSERTYHLGGAVATAILHQFLDRDWVRRGTARRLLDVTPSGRAMLARYFTSP